MSTPIKDGGPAFPEVFTETRYENGEQYSHVYSSGGMTLRDWFAGKALAGFAHNTATPKDLAWFRKYAPEHCFEIADAMLAARNREK